MITCKNCQTDFEISSEEESLRNLIGNSLETGNVPKPTLCPDCRMQRRMARRNERFLYQRKCDLTGKPIISVYIESSPFPVYEKTVWWSDDWDAQNFGKDFDFSKPFFEQFHELQNVVPRPAMMGKNVTNCDYSNFCLDSKNCYLSHCSYRSEDLLYCYWLDKSKNCIDCSYMAFSEQCFDCVDCNRSYNLRHCAESHQCTDSFFLYDCRSLRDCFGCVGLRQKAYCFFNEQLSKDEYEIRKGSYDLENGEHIKEIKEKLCSLKMRHPHRNSIQDKTENCAGDYIFNSKNSEHCFDCYDGEDCLYTADVIGLKNCLDTYHSGWSQSVYEAYSPVNQQNSAFTSICWDGSDNFYCDTCFGIFHCFGCVGLKHKSYCILNKQFTKEEYEKLLPEVVNQMKVSNQWGEYFPINISPFCYNETIAQEHYPLSKEKALNLGCSWRDSDPREYKPQSYEGSNRIEEVSDTILKEILACVNCGKNYRIIEQELKIYRDKIIALPKLCPDCRHKTRLSLRNPRRLFERKCGKCSKSISTTYSPERKEIVCCENCYLKEIY